MPVTRVLSLLFLATILTAEDTPDATDTAFAYAKARHADAIALRSYTWKEQQEVKVEGESTGKLVFAISHADGKLQKTPVNPPEAGRKKVLFGRRKQKRAAALKAWTDAVLAHCAQYIQPTPGRLVDFLIKADSADGVGAFIGTACWSGGALCQAGDKAQLWIDKKSNEPRRLVFTTRVGEDTVQGTLDFGELGGGSLYVARAQLVCASQKREIVIENVEHARKVATAPKAG